MTIAKMMERVDSGYYMSDKSTCMAKVERDFNAIIYGSICPRPPCSHDVREGAILRCSGRRTRRGHCQQRHRQSISQDCLALVQRGLRDAPPSLCGSRR